MRNLIIFLIFFMLAALPAVSVENDGPEETGEPVEESVLWMVADLPGTGAGSLEINPIDGSLWIFFHQTKNLVAIDPSDGSILHDIGLPISFSSMAFNDYEPLLYIAGEPLDDQRIAEGIVLVLNTDTGEVMTQLDIDSACNAVHFGDDYSIYVATGLQYGYQGTVYKLGLNQYEDGTSELIEFARADCGKIPWAVADQDGVLYVTDLELQWTMQADETMGPPYGAWVWTYEESSLAYMGSVWVGINPDSLVETNFGILVGCAGMKQAEGSAMEPALTLVRPDSETVSIWIGTAGASSMTVSPDGNTVIASLADWAPPTPGSAMAYLGETYGDYFPDARRWLYTGDIAVITFNNGSIESERLEIIENGYITEVAYSLDGQNLYVISGDPEKLLIIPISAFDGYSGDAMFDALDWQD